MTEFVSQVRRKTVLTAFCIVALAALMMPFIAPSAQAEPGAEDTTSPTITSIGITPSEVAAGDAFTLNLNVTEEETGYTEVHIVFRHNTQGDSGIAGTQFSCDQTFDQVQYSGSITLTATVPDAALAGSWHIESISIRDQKGNEALYTYSLTSDGSYHLGCNGKEQELDISGFSITNDTRSDTTPPALTGIRVITPGATVERPGSIAVEISFRDEGTGVAHASVSALPSFACTGNSIVHGAGADRECTEAERASGVMVIEIPIEANAVVGDWSIAEVCLTDQAGNQKRVSVFGHSNELTYDWITVNGQDQRTPHFSVVATGEYIDDRTAPEITNIRVLNDGAINRPGLVRVEVSFRDEGGSGLDLSTVSANLWSDCDGKNPLMRVNGSYEYNGEEVYSEGSVIIELPIKSTDPVGDWCITEFFLRDKAGNSMLQTIHGQSGDSLYNWFVINGESVQTPHFEVKDEFDFQFEAALSNPQIIESLRSLNEGKAARILIDGDATLSREMLDAIAGRDVTLVLYQDAYQWVICGSGIEGETKDIVLSLSLWKEPGVEYGGENDVVRLVFYPNGKLPCPVQVRFKSDYLYSFANVSGALHLYYLNDDELVEEDGDIDLVFDGTDKWCYVDITHNSEFIVSPEIKHESGTISGDGGSEADEFAKETLGEDDVFTGRETGDAKPSKPSVAMPQTSDESTLSLALWLALCSLAVLVVSRKLRKS